MSNEGKLKFFGLRNLMDIPQLKILSPEERFGIYVAAHVFPFRTNSYVIDELINWNNVPDDPIFRLTFPSPEMLEIEEYNDLADLISSDADKEEIKAVVNRIRFKLNPHPAGQLIANVPVLDDERVQGVQHKYNETALIFPSNGQTCHAYCTFCFRWAQFTGMTDLKFATDEAKRYLDYIAEHKELTDVLITGGDPMIMTSKHLEAYIEPLLSTEFDHIKNIRIGSKSLSYWPYRFLTDKDSDAILRLFEKVVKSGKHLAFMAHFNHWVELSTPAVRKAIERLKNAGVEIRTQSPLIRNINDSADVWQRMWQEQVNLGLIPYYMFVERDTGAHHYFAVPLAEAVEIFRDAYSNVSGLARTVRGPSMSSTPGKVNIEGISEINGEKVFVLNFIQARNPEWLKRPFFAKYDTEATWLDELEPAFEDEFFFEEELAEILAQKADEYNISK
ncbi:MAG: lysine 2,3-aminomutase [Ignavibacteria bacterium]|nr:MAG: lysine 2,3-aminomutase [Ignavibacteria bacterium]